MVLEESFQFIAVFVITIVFSMASLMNTEYRIMLKVIAGLSWFIMALTQYYYFGGSQVLAYPLTFLFLGFGLVFSFSIVSDFKQKERDRVYGFMGD
jgi:uncharacterized membrane protein